MTFRTVGGKVLSGPQTRINLADNPSFRATSGTVEARRNLVANPNFEVDTVGWAYDTGSPTLTSSTDRAVVGTKSLKLVTTIDSNDCACRMSANVVAGMTYTLSWYVYVSEGRDAYVDIAGAYSSSGAATRVAATIGAWKRISTTFTPGASGSVTFYFHNRTTGQTVVTAGQATVYLDAVMLETAAVALPYFDGSTAASGGLTYSWVGTANNSDSIATGVKVTGSDWHSNGGATYQSSLYAGPGRFSLAVAANKYGNNDSFSAIAVGAGMVNNKTYVLSGNITLTAPQTGTTNLNARGFRVTWGGLMQTLTTVQGAPNTAGTYRVIQKFTSPATGSPDFIRVYNGGSVGDPTVYWNDITIEEDGPVTGTFFDGSTETPTTVCRWIGAVDNSDSEEIKKWPLSILDIDGVTWRTLESIIPRQNVMVNPRGALATGTVVLRTNMLNNPNGEGALGWSNNNATIWNISWDTTIYRSGTRSRRMEIVAGQTNSYIMSMYAVGHDFTAANRPKPTVGKNYTFSAWLYTNASGQEGGVSITFQDVNNVTIGSNILSTPVALPVNQWTRVSLTAMAPAGTSTAYTGASVRSAGGLANAAPGQYAYVDDALFEEGSEVLPYFDGTTANKALNPGAEVNTSNTSGMGSSGTVLSRDTTIKRTGTASLKGVPSGTGGSGMKWNVANNSIQPGTPMTFTAYVYSTQAVTLSPYGEGSKVDNSYTGTVTSAVLNTTMTTVANQWTRISYSFIVQPNYDPSKTSGYGFLIVSPDPSKIVWVDDVTISEDPFGEDFAYVWTGVAAASTSIQRAPYAPGWSQTSRNNTGPDSLSYKRANGQVRFLTRPGSYSWNVFTAALKTTDIKPGTPLTILFKATAGGYFAQTPPTRTMTIVETNTANGIGANTAPFTVTSTPTEFRLKVVATQDPSDTAVLYMGLGASTTTAGWMDFDYCLIILEDYNGSYFDGDTAANPDYTYSWNGPANDWGGVSVATPR